MPIPKITEDKTIAEIEELYKEFGWFKTIEFNWIVVDGRTKVPRLTRWIFNSNSVSCDTAECRALGVTFMQLRPTGVMWTCASCRKTDGPISFDGIGRELLDHRRDLSLNEAYKILARTGQQHPVGLPKPGKRGYRIVP